jgi:PBSX family phage terminase large subunit
MSNIRISDIVAQPHLEHFNSMLPNQCDHGGRAGYKSSKNAIKIALLMLQNPNIEVMVLRQDYSDHKNTTFRDLIWAFQRLGVDLVAGVHYPNGNDLWIRLPQGNYVHFDQMKVKDKLKGYRPTRPENVINIAWFFEITQYTDESYIVEARSGIMRESGDWFIALYEWNDAPKLSDWTYEFMDKMSKREDAYVKKTNYNDAPEWQQVSFLGKPLMKEIEILNTIDPEQYKSTYLGLPANLAGTVYKMFNRKRNVKPATNNYIDITVGVDIGANDATVFTAKGVRPNYNGIEIFKTQYHKNGVTGQIKSLSDYVDDLMQFCSEIYAQFKKPITVYTDNNNLFYYREVMDLSYTNEYNFIIVKPLPKMKKLKGSKKEKSILQGRADMNNLMYGAGYKTIDPSCVELIAAIEQREFNKKGDPADDGRSDVDSIDSDDYSWLNDMDFMYDVIMTRPSNTPPIDTSNIIE